MHLGEDRAHPQATKVRDSEAGAGRAPSDNKPWLGTLDAVTGGVCAFVLHRGDSWYETAILDPLQRMSSLAMSKPGSKLLLQIHHCERKRKAETRPWLTGFLSPPQGA